MSSDRTRSIDDGEMCHERRSCPLGAGAERLSRRRVLRTLGVSLLWALPLVVTAQAPAFPTKPIRLVVAYPPGGGTNTVARLLADHLSKTLGPVVVENRSGAGGRVGAESVVRAEPNGYTLLLAADAELVIAPAVVKSMPYVPTRDLEPITLIGTVPYVLAAHPDFPPNTLAELIAYAKANPNKLNYGSFGTGSATHLLSEQFNEAAGIHAVNVPYAGSAPVMTALVGGHIQYAFVTPLASLALVKAGKLKAIAVTSAQRLAQADTIPTMTEAGLPGFTGGSWFSLHAPANTPKPVVERIRAEVIAALKTPELAKAFMDLVVVPSTSTPGELTRLMQAETRKWQQVAAKIGLVPE